MYPKNKIRPLQAALKDLGLYDGKVDGIIGPKTLAAFDELERTYNVKPEVIEVEAEPLPAPDLDSEGASIEEALPFTLVNEGGYSNHPADKGGPTKKGITIHRLSDYLGRKATANDVKNLSDETITLIYKKYYWDVMNLDKVVDQSIATCLFDMGVLNGTGTCAKMAQEVLGVKADGKIGPVTLNALNTTTDEIFIPKFVTRVIKRFEGIVASNPSQSVFLKGWKNRASRLLTLINDDTVATPEPTKPVPVSTDSLKDKLLALSIGTPVTIDDINRLISVGNPNNRYWAVFKIHQHSSKKRGFLFDVVGMKVENEYQTHGTGSDPDNNGIADKFSNIPNSKMSSLGLYRTTVTYTMAKHGRALRLDGLEESNNKALIRGVVFHGVPYANESYVKANGKCGRSWGCPAVDYSVAQPWIDKLKGGSILLIS